MTPSSSGSFIPKRNPSNRPTPGGRRNFFVMSMISYALFIAAPLASIAVFIYDRHTVTQFNKAVANLETEINTFNEVDFARVADFDDRLLLANTLLASHVSFVSLFSILESATAETVQFSEMTIKRSSDDTLSVDASLKTSALDGALFQRGAYNAKDGIASSVFSEVGFAALDGDGATLSGSKAVALKAQLTFNAADVLYLPITYTAPPTPEVIPAATDTTSSSSVEAASTTSETTI